MVTSKSYFAKPSHHTENSATNTAQQYTVTLPHLFAMDARQILQQWKQIADNMSSQLNLAGDKAVPTVATNADTHNLRLLLPSWERPVAEVAAPPPGAAVEVTDAAPAPLSPRANHLLAAQVPAEQHPRQGAAMSQRRREQNMQAYVPPE